MLQRKLKIALGIVAVASNLVPMALHAQMAQKPLLSSASAVAPNIVFILDDSVSMHPSGTASIGERGTGVYQFGGCATGYGVTGPGGPCGSDVGLTTKTYPAQSPDVNLIHYDPRVRYKIRVKADGTNETAGTASDVSSFNVYFWRASSGSVTAVTVNDGGKYAVPPVASTPSFSNAPTGGTRAVGSLTSKLVQRVSGVTISSVDGLQGGAYASCPGANSVTFGASTGGVQAVGTPNCTQVNNGITSVATSTSTHPASGACSLTINADGGSGAVIDFTMGTSGSNRVVTSFTVKNPGSNYGSNASVRVTCGSGSTRSYSETRNNYRRITSVDVNADNSGYPIAPTVTFPAGDYRTATGSSTVESFYTITSVAVSNGGAGYTTAPTFNITTSASSAPNLTVQLGSNGKYAGATGTSAENAADFFTPSYTETDTGKLAAGATAGLSYPNTPSSSTTLYPKFLARTDCSATYCSWADEQQNYANWKIYHSTRLEVAKTGIGLAFQPLAATGTQAAPFRLGWSTINTLAPSGNYSGGTLVSGVRAYNSAARTDFISWLYGVGTNSGGTPNKNTLNNVGKYFERKDNKGPWADTPDSTSTRISNDTLDAATNKNHASCRRSYAMLMTDGYYNDATNPDVGGDWDSTDRAVTGTSFTYVAKGPFSDKKSGDGSAYQNSMADIAMKYMLTDLRDDLGNNVPSAGSDTYNWQHMNFYAIGLGVDGELPVSTATLNTLSDPGRTQSWPTPAAATTKSIDDLWHATVNGRGELLSARTSEDLNAAVTKIMAAISGSAGTQAGVAVSTASLTQGTKKYTPRYTPISWTGNLTAYFLDVRTGSETGTEAWQVETPVTTSAGATTYKSTIVTGDDRKIYVGNGATTGVRAVEFKHSVMGSTLLGQMGGSPSVDLINHLRGDASKEATVYRARSTRLGDIVNSTPVFVKSSVDMKYEKLSTGGGTYRAHVTAKGLRTEGVIFVGANDGMLHAFRDGTYANVGDTTTTVTKGGAEVFAYVPNAILPTISQLSDKTYTHRYYVDGPNIETDAYVGGGWKNIVIGTTGGGAGGTTTGGSPRTGVFAINTTNLNTGPNTLAASDVMWEVGPSSTDTTYEEMGHVLHDVQTGVTKGGAWVAIFGNGYESKSCGARLFVVNLETGAKLREITVDAGACATTKNGLGGVRLVRNDDQEIIGAYAGDLQGNLWRFDMTDASIGSWTSSKFYSTGTADQPITAPPTVVPLPMKNLTAPKPGYMVVFGTGKFYEENDVNTELQQRLYGVWDQKLFGETADTTLSGVTALVAQAIETSETARGNTYYNVSKNTVSYDGADPKRGWYLPLTNSTRQRMIYPMELLANRFIVADTMTPEGVPTDPCSSDYGGAGYLYVLDSLNGGEPSEAVFDTSGDTNIDTADLVVAGVKNKTDGRNVSLLVSQTDLATKYANVSGGDPGATLIQISCRLTNSCAVTGGGAYRRQWRQLFLR